MVVARDDRPVLPARQRAPAPAGDAGRDHRDARAGGRDDRRLGLARRVARAPSSSPAPPSFSRRSCSPRPRVETSALTFCPADSGFMIYKDGSSGPLRPRARRGYRLVCTGRCEPLKVTCHRGGEHSIEKARRADPPSGGLSRLFPLPLHSSADGREGSPRFAAGLLRGRRAGGRDGRAGARAVRRPGLRPQADRPQPARRRASSRSAARSSSTTRPRCPRARRWCSRPTASRRRCTRTPRRGSLRTIDATCPLVTKVHVQARRYAAEGYTVILIGHAGHEEVVGTMGEIPDSIVLVESTERRRGARASRRTRSSPTSPRRRSRSTRPAR